MLKWAKVHAMVKKMSEITVIMCHHAQSVTKYIVASKAFVFLGYGVNRKEQ